MPSEAHERPTTGDPAVDQIIREKMSEACDIAFAVLQDRHPEFVNDNKEQVEKTVAILVSQLWQPMSAIITAGMKLAAQDMA